VCCYAGIGALLLLVLWWLGVGLGWGVHLGVLEDGGLCCVLDSVRVVPIQYVAIVLTAFVICRVGSMTECTFCWGVARFGAVAGVVLSTTFYAGVGLIAISLSMSVLLTSSTLWYGFIGARWFEENNPVLDGCQVVDFLVVWCRF
jgi:hypothetical protein